MRFRVIFGRVHAVVWPKISKKNSEQFKRFVYAFHSQSGFTGSVVVELRWASVCRH